MADVSKNPTRKSNHRKNVKKGGVKHPKILKASNFDGLQSDEKQAKKNVKLNSLPAEDKRVLKKKKDSKTEDNFEFKLDDILELGGEKEDYEQLLDIDEDEEIETDMVEDDIGNLQMEIQNFMQGIGFENENYIDFPKENDQTTKNNVTTSGKVQTEVPPPKPKSKNSDKGDDFESDVVRDTPSVKTKGKKIRIEENVKSLEYKKHDRLLLKNIIPWYDLTKHIPKSETTFSEKEIEKLHATVKQYWETEAEIYQGMKEKDKSSDAKWLRTVLTSGTLSDRVAALTMLTQESPVHSVKSLEVLMNMSKKKARREALIAIDSLRHIWIADLLPDYKLRKFNEFPFERLNEYTKTNTQEERLRLLITIVFEEDLKRIYGEFVEILQTFSKDTLADIRNKILGIVFELLQMKPEQEQVLLSILVNKLGDPERKVASKSSYLLCELVTKHPNMKQVVISEVERMMYRPNMSEKAQYYAICFLNQIVLSHEEKNVASKLISIYFSFFKVIVSRDNARKDKSSKNEPDSSRNKLLSGLLTGVNRAYPYVDEMEGLYEEQLNTLFKLTHVKHFSTSVQAFMLIYQVMESRQSVSDRYYQALYSKLLDPDINTSKHTMFLNLLYKSMKNDPVTKRVKAFVKRLLQVCAQFQPSLLCGVLYLISEVIKNNPGINSMIVQAEDEDEEEHFVDAALDEDLMNKCASSDGEGEKEADQVTDTKVKASWTFLDQDNKHVSYNANHRNPLYAGAEKSSLWETLPLLTHFHPSVMHFVTSIANTKEIEYKGDPSQDFTLISFLDRFMYRNPKQKEVEHGTSLMQRRETSIRRKEQPVNSKQFIQKSEENIPCDQIFFHRYFKMKTLDKDKTKEEEKEDIFQAEIDDVDDIDFAGEIKRDGEMKKKAKNKKDVDGSDSEIDDNDEEEENSGNEFDYDDLGEESSDDDDIVEKENFNDKDYEKALFETLDSDGESINGDQEEGTCDNDMDSMFADADEFSHMLEGDDEHVGGVHRKQIQWQEKQDNRHWKFKKNRNKGNFKRKNNFRNDKITKKPKTKK